MPVTPASGARFFTSLFGTQHGAPAFQYLWDESVVWTDTNGNLKTGAQRPITPGDFANISISGFTFTGELNVDNYTIISGQLIPLNVTGNLNTGSYGFNNSAITGSQTSIPQGAWSYSIYVESGTRGSTA